MTARSSAPPETSAGAGAAAGTATASLGAGRPLGGLPCADACRYACWRAAVRCSHEPSAGHPRLRKTTRGVAAAGAATRFVFRGAESRQFCTRCRNACRPATRARSRRLACVSRAAIVAPGRQQPPRRARAARTRRARVRAARASPFQELLARAAAALSPPRGRGALLRRFQHVRVGHSTRLRWRTRGARGRGPRLRGGRRAARQRARCALARAAPRVGPRPRARRRPAPLQAAHASHAGGRGGTAAAGALHRHGDRL